MKDRRALVERVTLVVGDVTLQETDAIVNAANSLLLGGGGVDGAIHQAAGPALLAECRTIGGCPTGEARITKGYRLKARWVIHTVGPVWRGGSVNEDLLLARCYKQCFAVASSRGIRTIAFPAISTGAYGFPALRAATIAVREITSGLTAYPSLESVVIVAFDEPMADVYRRALGGA